MSPVIPLRLGLPPIIALVDDLDARAYLRAVQKIDGAPLEKPWLIAVNKYIKQIKSSGAWGSIKTMGLLMGARTLPGALLPLKGGQPVSYNFTNSHYQRGFGLQGDGATRSLLLDHYGDTDLRNDRHIAFYLTDYVYTGVGATYLGAGSTINGGTAIFDQLVNNMSFRCSSNTNGNVSNFGRVGFTACNRISSGNFVCKSRSSNAVRNVSSTTPLAEQYALFSRLAIFAYAQGKINFYSAGSWVPDIDSYQQATDELVTTAVTLWP